MTQQQWRLRVRGKQRKEVKIELLVAAVMALGEQMLAEQRASQETAVEGRVIPLCRPKPEERA